MDLILETLKYGSVFQSLLSGKISPEDILSYLLDQNEPTIKDLIAYRCVCKFSKDQLVDTPEGLKPFILLTTNQKYIGIFSLSFSDLPGRNDNERVEIGKKVYPVMSKLMVIDDFSQDIHLFCDSGSMIRTELSEDQINNIVDARCTHHICRLLSKLVKTPEYFIHNDYLDPLEYIDFELYKEIFMERCEHLKQHVNLYWETIAQDLYRRVLIENIVIDNPNLSKTEIKRLDKLFPNIFSPKLLEGSDLLFNLKKLPELIQAYLLGFPIHEYYPSSQVLETALNKLETLGLDSYVESIIETNKEYLSDPGFIVGNEKDELMEPIEGYSLFDIVKIYNETHVYYFTRPGLGSILQTKKNPWSNVPLPFSILSTINSRLDTAAISGFPDSAPLKELLESLTERSFSPEENQENLANSLFDMLITMQWENIPEQFNELESMD